MTGREAGAVPPSPSLQHLVRPPRPPATPGCPPAAVLLQVTPNWKTPARLFTEFSRSPRQRRPLAAGVLTLDELLSALLSATWR